MVLFKNFPKKYTIGGKAAGLVQLKNAGIKVPDFLVIPAETFESIVNISPSADYDIKSGLSSFVLDSEDKKVIEMKLKKWDFPATPVVVRSSIGDEDGSENSFAGLMDSFINLTSLEEVYNAVSKCAASAYSSRAVEYRKQKILTSRAKPAIIIQQQVHAISSGVIFSTYPQYPQELAIHAVWGFGEGLVSGQFQPDEFYLSKKDGTISRRVIADKYQQVACNVSGGTIVKKVELEKRNIPCIASAQLEELFSLANSLEMFSGHPRDIEFAIDNDQIWIVQSRPITEPIMEIVVYDNSNIQESYCGVTTPLTFSFAQRAYATVYKQTMQVLDLPKKVINEHEEVVNNLLGLIKGRIYYNINNWYKGLLLLPSFKQNKEDMERMMGLQEPVDFVRGTNKTVIEKIKLFPSLIVNLVRLLRAFKRLNTTIPIFHKQFSNHYNHFYSTNENLNIGQLIIRKKNLDKELLFNWTTPIINDFYVMMNNGQVHRKLKKAGIEDVQEFLSRYLSGDQQIESAQPAYAMRTLAEEAKRDPLLTDLINSLPNNLHDQVEQRHPAFYKGVMDFIEAYGDRTVGELKLETITMRIEPMIFYKYLRNFLQPGVRMLSGNSSLKQAALEELKVKLQKHPERYNKGVMKSLKKLQKAISNREALRLERTRLFGMYRSVYLSMGDLFSTKGFLRAPRDIFFLTEEEIIQLSLKNENVTALVTDRKKEFESFLNEDVPSRVIVPSPPLIHSDEGDADLSKMAGTGCYPGIVTGEAIVVMGPESNLDVQGKILCALRTDPGWVALFPTCKAVLIEKGSSLSHSVILLREFGIPTIINIPGLTKSVSNGQHLKINAFTGEIQIVDSEH